MRTLKLLPQFMDRSGRIIYNIVPAVGLGDAIMGTIRLKEGDDTSPTMLEWAPKAQTNELMGETKTNAKT